MVCLRRILVIYLCVSTAVLPAAVNLNDSIRLPEHTNLLPSGSVYVYGDPNMDKLISVKVFGGVGKAGIHFVPPDTDLLTLISLAGGTIDSAEIDSIQIRRTTTGKPTFLAVNLEDVMSKTDTEPVKLAEGDTVVIPVTASVISDNTLKVVSFVSSLAAIFTTIWLVTTRK